MSTEFFVSHDSAANTLTTHEHIGFELGWDYAHHNITPPAPYGLEPSPLRNGLLAGAATFGLRTLQPTRHVRKWLQLRLHAWLRGRSVELVRVTPHFLQQIDVSHCPVTRVALSSATLQGSDTSVDRVRSDAGYAAGNLAVMSTQANHAKAAHGYRSALAQMHAVQASDAGGLGGFTADQWARVATLCSFVEPLPHAEACALPLLVLPPNRLRLFNPAQALQAFISQQLLQPGWSHRLVRFEDLLPGKVCKRAFQTFFHALLPRVLEAGKSAHKTNPNTPALQAQRWAIEDAWRNPLALQRWTAFASQLTPEQCEALVARASAKKLATLRIERVSDEAATEGWQLESRGYVPHAVLMRRSVPRGVMGASTAPASGSVPALRLPQQAHLPLQ